MNPEFLLTLGVVNEVDCRLRSLNAARCPRWMETVKSL